MTFTTQLSALAAIQTFFAFVNVKPPIIKERKGNLFLIPPTRDLDRVESFPTTPNLLPEVLRRGVAPMLIVFNQFPAIQGIIRIQQKMSPMLILYASISEIMVNIPSYTMK